jgi:hypothetical protein
MVLINTTGAGATILPEMRKVITGASLVHRALNKRQRAVVAAEVADGTAWLILTQSQLATILNVSAGYIRTARSLSPSRRTAILQGEDHTSFADLSARLAPPKVRRNGKIDDAALVDLARKVGVDRLLTAAITAERDS